MWVEAAASAGTPLWKDLFTVTNDTLRTAAVLTAGAFGYIKFVRGRTHHASLNPSLEAKVVELAGALSLHLKATIANNGTFRMTFPLGCQQLVTVECASNQLWTQACAAKREIDWIGTPVTAVELLNVDGAIDADQFLEPGEQFLRERLIPLPTDDWVALRVRFVVKPYCKKLFRAVPTNGWETTVALMKDGT